MRHELRRTRWLGAAGAVVLGFVAVVALVPVPFVALSPGPTFNTIGDVGGTPLITISGEQTYPTAGTLDMTTVSERGGPFGAMYVSRALAGWLDPTVRVVPTEALYPADVPAEQVAQENQADFVDSQSSAVAAALHQLDIPVQEHVVVSSVTSGTPADGVLEPGDVVLSVDGTEVTTPDQVGAAVRAGAPGDEVVLRIDRDGDERTVTVVAGTSPTTGGAYLGITVATAYEAPFEIDFTLDDVGGPSAGLMFSLGIVDKLTPGYLNGGREVAGTGTIDPDGVVGPIGGIQQKLVGARDSGSTLFLAPRSNCDEVAGHVPDGLTVAAVGTLDEAVDALDDYVAGRAVPSC